MPISSRGATGISVPVMTIVDNVFVAKSFDAFAATIGCRFIAIAADAGGAKVARPLTVRATATTTETPRRTA